MVIKASTPPVIKASTAPVIPGVVRLALDVTLPGLVIDKTNYTKLKDRGTSGAITVTPTVSTANPSGDGWTYEHDAAKPGVLRRMKYTDKTYQQMTSEVFDTIEWQTVKVAGAWTAGGGALTGSAGAPLDLPLDPAYLLFRLEWTGGGKITRTSNLWPIPDWEIDSALILIFAYELTLSGSSPSTATVKIDKVPAEEWSNAGFMGAPTVCGVPGGNDSPATDAPPASASASARTTQVIMGAHTAVVVLTWTGLRPLADFEPTQQVVMTRNFPHAFVLSDLPFHTVESPVRVKRRSQSNHVVPPSQWDEGMGPELRAMLITETNIERAWTPHVQGGPLGTGGAPRAPYWPWIFDYLREVPGAIGPLKMVDHAQTNTRSAPNAVTQVTGPSTTLAMTVDKVPRQGAYDNLHISARLRAPAYFVANNPAIAGILDDVKQAPACDCDCLHLHWRWGTIFWPQQNLGWGSKGPYTELGAPMVPENQDVLFEALTPTEFVQTSIAFTTKPNEWQVFFHQGMAFALNFSDWLYPVGAAVLRLNDFSDEPFRWPAVLLPGGYALGYDAIYKFKSLFYFTMRYHTRTSPSGGLTAVERLQVTPQNLAMLEAL